MAESFLDIIKEQCRGDDLQLPVYPATAVQIQKLIDQNDFSLKQVSDLICRDQALASEVLKLANSAFFAGFRKIGSIQDAVMRLGAKQILNCIIMMGQKNLYRSNNKLLNSYLQSLWVHATACAMGTKCLLDKTGYKDLAQEGFLAGLLHDIGKLVLLKVVEEVSSSTPIPLADSFLIEVLENLHVEQGFVFAERWSFPEGYCRVIRDHHREDFDQSDILLLAVRIANEVCHKAGLGMRKEPSLVLPSLPEVHAMGVREIILAELEVFIEDHVSAA
ncbi:MAG: HDOD domain-containing protein [Syntrophobacteraceae bacterium]